MTMAEKKNQHPQLTGAEIIRANKSGFSPWGMRS